MLPLPTGSEPDHQSEWPMLQDLCYQLGLPVDEAVALLLGQRIWAQPHTRLPPRVVIDALLVNGWRPRRLERLR